MSDYDKTQLCLWITTRQAEALTAAINARKAAQAGDHAKAQALRAEHDRLFDEIESALDGVPLGALDSFFARNHCDFSE